MRFVFWLLILLSLTSWAEEQKTWVIFHTNVPAEVKDSDGNVLGTSGKAIDLRFDSSQKSANFVLTAEGHEDQVVEASLEDLNSHRLPANGKYTLESSSSPSFIPILLVVGLLGAGAVAMKPKKPVAKEELFQLGEQLGTGSSATVYRGFSSIVGEQEIAIKLLNQDYAEDDEFRQRYERESELALSLDHPNIVKVFHSGKAEDERPFLLMELLEGETLREALDKRSLPEDQVAPILLSLCDALIYLHEKSIIHRDIKPGNIYLAKSGEIKLLDLGIARAEESVAITQAGETVGTPSYMAPEQIQGKTSPLTDQYSVGVIMFELLGGRRPFTGDDVIKQHLTESPPLLTDLDPEVTPFQDSVVTRLLEKRPDARFPNMTEAREAIATCLADSSDGTMTC